MTELCQHKAVLLDMATHLCLRAFVSSIAFSSFVFTIPIDNSIKGDAEVSCGQNSITVNFNTRKDWEGQLYVKNHHAEEQSCVVRAAGRTRLASLELPFDTCGVTRERSIEPKGVFVTVTVVMSFHSALLTKVDRAVKARCFYMELDKQVSDDFEVSAPTSAFATFAVPMPALDVVLLQQISEKLRIRQAKQFHLRKLATRYGITGYAKLIIVTDTFCSFPYNCYVDDGNGDTQELLDVDGCAIDKHLLDNIEFVSDLHARKEAHVFKFADKPNLYFNCQVRVEIKEPGEKCLRPECRSLRRKRAPVDNADKNGRLPDGRLVTDVSVPHPILVAEIDIDDADLPQQLFRKHTVLNTKQLQIGNTCVSLMTVWLFLTMSVFTVACWLIICIVVATRRKQAKTSALNVS